MTEIIILAVAELQQALVARERAKQDFIIATGSSNGHAVDRQSFATIPPYVRAAGERVSVARLALDLALLEDA